MEKNYFKQLTPEQQASLLAELRQAEAEYDTSFEANMSRLDVLKERANSLPQKMEEYIELFEKETGLTKKDDAFLVFAVALQIARQEILNRFKDRLSDQESAKRTPGHNNDEHSNRTDSYYASKEEIVSNPVPFDCIQREASLRQSDMNPGINGFNHRYKALGHDPILGFIFGTANIMTNTLTMTEGGFSLKSYHVHTGVGTINGISFLTDKMNEPASTAEIFASIGRRLQREGKDGWEALGTALGKELIHLLSDVRTRQSLPVPFLSIASPKLSHLAGINGFDMLNFAVLGSEMTFAYLINFIIGKLHQWCYNPQTDGSFESYQARTLKIVMYSGELATLKSIAQTGIQMYAGDATNLKYFDFGGALVALYNTLNTEIKIQELKQEYVINNLLKFISAK